MPGLFSDYTLRGKRIKNRVVFPPVVNFSWAGPDGLATDRHVRHYEAIARGGAGVIVVEATCVSEEARAFPDQLCLYLDEHTASLARIAAACRPYGPLLLVQLQHGGMNTRSSVRKLRLGPSDGEGARAMTREEIGETKRCFVAAALRCREAGFDGVELHGAHGYLLANFGTVGLNNRTDEYGGSTENRQRLTCEIIREIRAACGGDFVIALRFGASLPDVGEGIAAARFLEEAGADFLNVSSGANDSVFPPAPEGLDVNGVCSLGIEIKKHTRLPVAAVNRIRTPARAAALVEGGYSDFVAIGRDMLTDYEWTNKAERGEQPILCAGCRECVWSLGRCPRRARGT